MEAPNTGNSYGSGIYFADMFIKSHDYCYSSAILSNKRGIQKKKDTTLSYKYMLLCEVVLGNIYQLGLGHTWSSFDIIKNSIMKQVNNRWI